MAFVVIPEFKIKEDKVDAFKDLMAAHCKNSFTNEEGCLGFECCQDVDDPTRFVLYETYVDAAALDIHRDTAHFAWYQENAKDLVVPGPNGTLFQSVARFNRTSSGQND